MTRSTPFKRILVIVIAMLVPLLAVGAFTTTLAAPAQHMDNVVAAVVNNDEPVELEGQQVPLGRQLAAALVEGQGRDTIDGEAANYSWVMTNDQLAQEGLDSGQYVAVVRIPPEFSRAATSTMDPQGHPEQALVDVTYSPQARLADEAITHAIVDAAASFLGSELTSTYLENIFVGFNTLGEELHGAADGAQALATGASELAAGADELADGTDQLATGARDVASGTGELAAGAGTLAAGAQELAGGTSTLAGGARDLAGGLGELSGGMNDLSGGGGELARGASKLKAGSSDLSAGTNDLAAGAQELAAGSHKYAAGVDEFSAGLGELTGGAHDLTGGLGELNDAVAIVPDYLERIEADLETGADAVRDFAAELSDASGSFERIITAICADDPQGAACLALEQYLGQFEDIDEFLATAAAGLNGLADRMESALDEGGGLGQIQDLLTGIDLLATGAGELAGGLEELHQGSAGLAEGAHGLATGNDELAAGARELAGGAAELDGGVGQLRTGAQDLGAGAGRLAGASAQAADGAGELAGGAAALAGGTQELSNGAGAVAGGARDLAAGTGELAGGADELAAGTLTLAEGTGELTEGSQELANGLDQAVEEIPTYPDETRKTLADVIADPVGLGGSGGLGLRWVAFFAVVALWVGGMWLLRTHPAVAPHAATSTRSAAALTWRSLKTPLFIAAAQGLGVGALVGIFGNLSASTAIGITLLAALASLVFTTVQRAMVAWGGIVGVAAIVLIALFVVATALVSAMPPAASAVVSWLPLGPAILAAQMLESAPTGGAGSLLGPLFGLVAWAGAGVIGVIAATRRKQGQVN